MSQMTLQWSIRASASHLDGVFIRKETKVKSNDTDMDLRDSGCNLVGVSEGSGD